MNKEGIRLGHDTTMCGASKVWFPMRYIFDHIAPKANIIVTEINRQRDLFKYVLIMSVAL